MISIFNSKILDIKYLTKTVKQIKLSVPEGFSFKPGQYVSLTIIKEGKKIRKPFSIASNPKNNFIELCIKLVKNSETSKYIDNLKKNDEVELFGPAGKFTIQNKEKDICFISMGTGIAPFRSMVLDLLENNFKNKIIIFLGFRNEKNILYKKDFSKVKIYNILSQPKGRNYKFKGHVQDFLKEIPKDFKGDFYICGLTEMVDSTKEKLISLGFEEKNIFVEKYD